MQSDTVFTPRPSIFRDGLILGLITAIGPFAVDMYLPSLPLIGAALHTDPDSALFSMTAFFITFALGQLLFGPISDVVDEYHFLLNHTQTAELLKKLGGNT